MTLCSFDRKEGLLSCWADVWRPWEKWVQGYSVCHFYMAHSKQVHPVNQVITFMKVEETTKIKRWVRSGKQLGVSDATAETTLTLVRHGWTSTAMQLVLELIRLWKDQIGQWKKMPDWMKVYRGFTFQSPDRSLKHIDILFQLDLRKIELQYFRAVAKVSVTFIQPQNRLRPRATQLRVQVYTSEGLLLMSVSPPPQTEHSVCCILGYGKVCRKMRNSSMFSFRRRCYLSSSSLQAHADLHTFLSCFPPFIPILNSLQGMILLGTDQTVI